MELGAVIQTITLYAIPVLLAITLHEAAHGWVALRLGDNTAAQLGRVTFNPMAHVDPVGTVLMPLVLYLATSGAFLFGYAKPVPVNFSRLHQPKRDMVWVALAGPGANLLMALIWAVLLHLYQAVGISEPFLVEMAQGGVLANVVMLVFNLFPLPPLDGGRILVGVLPLRPALAVARLERWGFFIVMALVVAGVISNLWMRPLMRLSYGLINLLLTPLTWVLGG